MDDTRIPTKLKKLKRWCNWEEGTKAPTPAVGHALLTFDEARAISDRIGYHFTSRDPYAGIDIDMMTPMAHRLLAAARARGAYIERSPSGRGWHILGYGRLPRGIGKGRVDDGVEAYDDGRYFTVTGDGDGELVDIQDLLDELIALLPSPNTHMESEGGAQWDEDTHLPLLAHADCESYENWVAVGMALKDAGAEFEVWDEWAQTSSKWPGSAAASAKWESFRGAGRTLGTLYMLAREGGWIEDYDVFDVIEPPKVTNAWEAAGVDAHTLTHAPPARTWAWDQWIPHGVVTGLAGEPGVAKSTMALQLCVHHALGEPYMGAQVGKGPAVFITVEDDADELHRRYHRVCDGLFRNPDEVAGLFLIAATNMVTELVKVMKEGGNVRETTLMKMLDELMVKRWVELIVLDLVGDFWDGNENERGAVSSYIRAHLGRFAQRHGCAVLVISHLNKAGGVSGSTAWLGSYRSAISMVRAANDVIEVQRIKANYAPPMKNPVKVRWADGYIAPIPRAVLDAEEMEALELQLAALPRDEWMGVQALKECWGLTNIAQTKKAVLHMMELNWVTDRPRGGSTQWCVV